MLVAVIYLGAFAVSVYTCHIGTVNRLIITISYSIVMCVTVISSIIFLCILKAKYGSKFLQKRK